MADLIITPANVKNDTTLPCQTKTGIAGGTITAGQPLYADAADSNKVKAADSNVSAALAAVVGIAAHGATLDQPITYFVPLGDFNPGASVTIGETYYLSETVGGIQPSADLGTGEFVTPLFIGVTTSKVRLDIMRATGIQKP